MSARPGAVGAPDESAYAAALSGLPGMGPAGLCRLLAGRSPSDVWADVAAGRVRRRTSSSGATPSPDWQTVASRFDPVPWWAAQVLKGVGVTWPGRPDFPEALAADPSPPGCLFWRGRLEMLRRPCVALVGSRRASPDGRAVAYEIGRDLAAAGVCVVSGLALGIDGAAHAGALAVPPAATPAEGTTPAGPAGVAASGVDVPYPRRHRDLWERVAVEGVVVSETLPGRAPTSWRFPARNRIIAGLCRMVVVVESHHGGGSLITAEAAAGRGVEVGAVPGPVRSRACEGSNQLLYDGATPIRHAQDILDALGLLLPQRRLRSVGRSAEQEAAAMAAPGAGAVLAALGHLPSSVGRLMSLTGLPAPAVTRALDELQAGGLAREDGGWWTRLPGCRSDHSRPDRL